MAAYNAGPNRVKRAIARTGTRDFWENLTHSVLEARDPKLRSFDSGYHHHCQGPRALRIHRGSRPACDFRYRFGRCTGGSWYCREMRGHESGRDEETQSRAQTMGHPVESRGVCSQDSRGIVGSFLSSHGDRSGRKKESVSWRIPFVVAILFPKSPGNIERR